MKRRILTKLTLMLILIVLTCGILSINVQAASTSIKASSTNVKVGTRVTITINWTAASWDLVVSGDGISTERYASVTDDAENASFSETISFTPTSAGTYTINLTGSVTDENSVDSDGKPVSTPVNKSISIRVTENSSSSGGNGNSGGNTSGGGSSNTGDDDEGETPNITFTSTSGTGYATTDEVNIRSNPSLSAEVIDQLDKGDSITITGIGNGWYRVNYGGQTAYVSSSYITTTKPTSTEDEKKTEEDDKKNEDDNENKSNAKELSSLTVEQYKLEPDFSPDITEYSLTVGRDVENLVIEAVASDENATVEITGNNGLLLGENTVNIKVTAEDGTVRTYKINVTKVEEVGLKLSELTIENYVLTPEFSSDVYEYTLNIGDISVTSLNIIANSADENINVEIVGNNNLKPGENIITILVSSDEEDITTVYQIIVNINESFTDQVIIKDNSNMYIYIGIGLAVLILLIIIIVVVRKRRKAAEEEFAPLNTYDLNFSSNKDDKDSTGSDDINSEENTKKAEKARRKKEKSEENDYSLNSNNYESDETPRRGRGKHF